MPSRKKLYSMTVACICVIKKDNFKKKTRRTRWMKEWLQKRNEYSHINLLEELRLEPSDWHNYLRMDEESYTELLHLVTPLLQKQDTRMRPCISVHERLTATLRFLATGRTYEDLKFSTLISPQALGKIIPETCDAIYSVLKNDFLKFPTTVDEWKAIAAEFRKKCDFPNCLGAVDGKHIRITAPSGSGSYFWNYKGYNSLVLMAITNANYEFVLCDFGTNGRISDGGVIDNTIFYDKLKTGKLLLPLPKKPIGSDKELPFVFIGDEAFALRPDFLKPFNQKELNHDKKIFNYRLSRARRIVENTFGIMACRFRIFHTAISVSLERIDKIVMACCVLHNFLRKKCSERYVPNECCDIEDVENGDIHLGLRADTLAGLQRGYNRHASNVAISVRKLYLKYFNEEGTVSWQEAMIK